MAFSAIASSLATHTVGATAQTLSAASVTVPSSAAYAEGYVRTASIVMTRDGTTPTATKGEQWDAGDQIYLRSAQEIATASFIRQGGVSATIDWQFFNTAPYAAGE